MNVRTKFSFTRSRDNKGYLKTLGSPWIRLHSLFANILWAFVPMDPVNVPAKFEVRSFTRSAVPQIIGGALKLWPVPGFARRPRFLFCEIFNGLLFGWTL